MGDIFKEQKLFGLYRGKVVRHLNRGMLKVYVPGVHPPEWESQPQYLPDCEQSTPLFAGNANGNGMFSYPNVGAIVLCMFFNGDQNYPVVVGSTLGGGLAANEYQETRPNVTTATVDSGDDAYVHKINSGYSSIKIWESGRLEITINGNEAGSCCSKIWMDGKGTINIDATQQISLHAPSISLSADSSMSIETPTYSNINGISNTTIAPAINLDAQKSGSGSATVLIKGARHSQAFN